MAEANFVPAVTEITVVRGDTVALILPIQTTGEVDADLTGYTVATEVSQPTLDDVNPASSISGSTVTINITGAQTEALEDASRITTTITSSDASVIRTVLFGRISIITKDA